MKRLFGLGTMTFLLLSACAPSNPKRQPPVRTFSATEETAQEETADFNSKVDILFVIDNSTSMKEEQANLVKNIDEFAKAFSKNTTLDFHIGVLTVFDSGKYGQPGRLIRANGHLWPVERSCR
jgi:hypothetical protein